MRFVFQHIGAERLVLKELIHNLSTIEGWLPANQLPMFVFGIVVLLVPPLLLLSLEFLFFFFVQQSFEQGSKFERDEKREKAYKWGECISKQKKSSAIETMSESFEESRVERERGKRY